MADPAATRKHPFALGEFFVLTTLAAVVVWLVNDSVWSADEKWVFGLSSSVALGAIAIARAFGARCGAWCCLGGMVGGCGSLWRVGEGIRTALATLAIAPESDALRGELLVLQIACPLLGLAIGVAMLLLFGAGVWGLSTKPGGLWPLARRRPLFAACCASVLLVSASAGNYYQVFRYPNDLAPRMFIPWVDGGRRVMFASKDKSSDCNWMDIAVSRDGRYVAVDVGCSFRASRGGGVGQGVGERTWVYDLALRGAEVPLPNIGVRKSQYRRWSTFLLSFGCDCDELVMARHLDLAVLSIPQGEIVGKVDDRRLINTGPRSARVVEVIGPFEGKVYMRVLTGYDNINDYIVDAHQTNSCKPNEAGLLPHPILRKLRRRHRPELNLVYLDGRCETVACRLQVRQSTLGHAEGVNQSDDSWLAKVPLIGSWYAAPRAKVVFVDAKDPLRQIAATRPFSSEVRNLALAHDGSVLAVATLEGLYIFDVPSRLR